MIYNNKISGLGKGNLEQLMRWMWLQILITVLCMKASALFVSFIQEMNLFQE